MENVLLLENKFHCIDFNSIAKLLESSYRLLNQDIEFRDPQGKVIFSYPPSEVQLFSDMSYQDLLHHGLSKGKIQRGIDNKNRCLIGLPIMEDGLFLGALVISTPRHICKDGFSRVKEFEFIKFYQCITEFIAKECNAQLETLSLSEELAVRYEELNLFYKVSEWLKGVQETETSIQLIIDKITDTLEGDHGFITLPTRGVFALSGSLNSYNIGKSKRQYLKELGEELLKIFTGNKSIILDKVHEHRTLKPYFPPSLSLIAVPVSSNGFHEGALGICFKCDLQNREFTTGDVRLLHSMAEVISILLKNIELYQNLKTFIVNVVKCLVSAIEAKDIYTRGHSERVNYISMLMANVMDLPQNVKENINWASMLHDIGKIGIPEAILTKPGKLTDEEFSEIKKHPERGYIILKPIQGLQESLDGVRFHQERYDGRGYPKGLKGKEIPLSARIIAIADTYDAITSNRAYRNSLSHHEALEEIKKVAGTQLDPDLVKVFLDLIESRGAQILKQVTLVKQK